MRPRTDHFSNFKTQKQNLSESRSLILSEPKHKVGPYRGTSPTGNRHPLGPYSRPVPRTLLCSWEGGAFFYGRATPVHRFLTRDPVSIKHRTPAVYFTAYLTLRTTLLPASLDLRHKNRTPTGITTVQCNNWTHSFQKGRGGVWLVLFKRGK